MANLAGVLMAMKRYDEAEQFYRQSLEIDKKVHGDELPNVANDLNNFALCLWEQDHDSAEAARLGKQALEIVEETFGPDHPHTQQYRRDWGGGDK